MTTEPETLPQLLRRLRGGRSPDDVARQVGVEKSSVYFWEQENTGRTRRRPSVAHLSKLLDIYGANDDQRLLAWQLLATPVAPPEDDALDNPPSAA